MSLRSNAQALYVIDPSSPASQLPARDTHMAEHKSEHSQEHVHQLGLHDLPLEVQEPGEIEIIVEELPGAPAGTKDPEPMLEVQEAPIQAEDANDAKKEETGGKNKRWDEKGGSHGFVAWIKDRLSNVPKHQGDNIGGCERACSYLEKLDNDISKHMREDLDGELDDNMVEKTRAEIDDGIARLQNRIDKIKKSKKPAKKKRAEYEIDADGFVKEAQKITGVQGVYVMVPLLISSIGRTILNGMISAGHDAEAMMHEQSAKWKLTDREQLELRQYLFDSGLAMRVDLGNKPEDNVEINSDKGFNWAQNFPDNSWSK